MNSKLIYTFSIVALVSLFGVIPTSLEAAEDSKTPGLIKFVAKNTVATANGTFHKWQFIQTDFDLDNLGDSIVVLEVDVASIDTKNKKRDNHLRTKDFFDVTKYPKATLKIFNITKSSAGYKATLEWTMHGITKSYDNFAFKVPSKGPLKVSGTFKINRMDFKIGKKYTKLNPMSIKEDIPITFDATLPE